MSDLSMTDPLPRSAHRDGAFGMALLHGLGAREMHVYGGTVHPDLIAVRRRNRAARKARRITRRSS